MSGKYNNIKCGIIPILLIFSLNIGTLAMSPNSDYKVSESISGLKFYRKEAIKVGKGVYSTSLISTYSLDKCLNILSSIDMIDSKKTLLIG